VDQPAGSGAGDAAKGVAVPITTLKIAPGVNSQITDAQGMAQIVESQLIRHKYAGSEVLVEKMGGWQKFYPTPMGSTPRALHAWEGINVDTHLAVGCTENLIVITDGALQDITPQTVTSTLAPSFSTTNGTNVVQIDDTNLTTNAFDSIYILVPVAIGGIVLEGAYPIETVLDTDSYTILAATDATATAGPGGDVPVFSTISGGTSVNVELVNHGRVVGTIFNAAVPTTVGGVTIFGAYVVQSVVDADNFTINATAAASATASADMNGGDTEIVYYIGGAPPPSSVGYGVGGYGEGGYGTGSSVTPTPGIPITTTNWSLDNWGEILIATPANDSIYTWSPDSGFPLAVRVVEAPLINGGAFIAQPAQILVAWASSQGGVQDPLSINWSDAGNFNEWDVTSRTQAGGYRLPTGSRIVGGMSGPHFPLIWTDLELWAMDYIGLPLVFGFRSIAQNCGLISQHGYATLNTVVYWMGPRNFFRANGEAVQTIPCSVWDFVFQDLDEANVDKIYAGSNSLFGEVTWYFPSASGGTGEVDSYVKFNPDLNVWDYGRLRRSAWIDQSPVGAPVGASPSGFIYQHEVSPDADGQPMLSSFKTGFYQVSDGDDLQFIDWMFPDFTWGYQNGDQDAVLQVTLYFCDYPNQAVKTAGPFTVSSAIEYVNLRLRGRFVAVEISSSDLGSFWRVGALKFRSAPDGKR
jgi:hypothetical protein